MNFQRFSSSLLTVFKVGMTWKKTSWKSDDQRSWHNLIRTFLSTKSNFFLPKSLDEVKVQRHPKNCCQAWSLDQFMTIIKHLDGIFVHVLLKGLHVAKNDQKDKDLLFSEKYARFWSGCPCKTNENSKLGSQWSRQIFVVLKSMKSFSSLCWKTTLALTWQSHKNLSLI